MPPTSVSLPLFLKCAGVATLSGVVVWIEPAPCDVAIVLLLIVGLLLGCLSFRPLHALPALLLGGFAIANLLSMVNAVDPQLGWRRAGITLYLVASWFFFTGLVTRYGEPAARLLIQCYVAAGVLSATLATLAYAGFLPWLEDILLMYRWRGRGFFKDPNVFGPYLVYVAVLAISRWDTPGTVWMRKALWTVALLVVSTGVLISFSRACCLNYAVSVVVYFWLRLLAGSIRSVFRALAFGGLLAVLLFLAIRIPEVQERVDLRLGNSGLQSYDADRFLNQQQALQTALERPFGVGPGQAELLLQYAIHSTYLQLFYETGILGLLFYLAFSLLTLYRCARLSLSAGTIEWRVRFAVIAACLTGHLVNTAVIDAIHWRHVWFWFALAWTAIPFAQGTRVAVKQHCNAGREPVLRR